MRCTINTPAGCRRGGLGRGRLCLRQPRRGREVDTYLPHDEIQLTIRHPADQTPYGTHERVDVRLLNPEFE